MKKTNIFYGNQYRGSFYAGMSRFQVFSHKVAKLTKRVLMVMGVFSIAGWSVYFGANYIPRTVYADRQVTVTVVASTTPVMQRIMKCESTASQKNGSGQLLIHVNKDGSYDSGIMQINSIWNAKATALGYDLSSESGNRAFGMWLYENIGTGPWASSSACWTK